MIPRVLIIDDDADTCESLAMLLESRGFRPLTATTGEQGILVANEEKPHILAIDLGLPDVGGKEICLRLSTEEWSNDATFIAVTGWTDEEAEALRVGFDHFLLKPVDPKRLFRLLASTILEQRLLQSQCSTTPARFRRQVIP